MKRVCVIGAGASGLPAIKCCLDEGLKPVCYERSHDIGGLWRYEEKVKEGGSVYQSIIINTSKEMMCYSDFPIPKEFANYMHNSKIIQYMRMYAKQFDLFSHIFFHTEVVKCEQSDDYDETGQWKVTTKNRNSNEIKTEMFDGVLVCIGHHAIPHNPCHSFPGFDKFKGESLHSHSYRKPFAFEGKRVVVIGLGNSGGDISVELGKHASKVFLSTRRGSWVLQRVGPKGIPLDFYGTTRFNSGLRNFLPHSFFNWYVEKQLNDQFDHARYGLKPKHNVFSQHATVNDSLPNSILSGMITVKGNVKEFTENGVIFDDGTSEDIDVVIFATGYNFSFPFLNESAIKVRNNECRLYKLVWPPHLKHGSLAVIGGIQPLGAVNPISEIQCRWAASVIKGNVRLPSSFEMNRDIDERLYNMKKLFYNSQRHTIQVDYVGYMDEIASQINVLPDVMKFLKEDFKLGFKILFGPVTSYQYRLIGPNKWAGARDAIMTQDERMLYPLNTRKSDIASNQSSTRWLLYLVFLILLYYFLF